MWWFGTFLLDFYLNCFVFPFCILLLLFQPYTNQPPLGCLSYTHNPCIYVSFSVVPFSRLFHCFHSVLTSSRSWVFRSYICWYLDMENDWITLSSSISFIFIHFVIWFFIAEIVMCWFFSSSHTYVVVFLHDFDTISSMKQNEFLLVQHPQK